MSIRQGNKVLSAGQSLTQNLFDFKWADHILDDIQWLRADTFTWHDGRVYEAAYQHLLAEWNEVGDVPSTETIAGIQIYYRLALDGHKICSASQEDEAIAIYEATGIAWYYILDTTNQRFKLPRTKFGFVGLRDNNVGKYIPESLPNITGEFDNMLNGTLKDGGYTSGLTTVNTSGAFTGVQKANTDWHIDTTNIATNQNGHYATSFDASRSSSVYQNNAPVQERSTQMYLYFFVGNFSQSAVVNTAGINATLVDEIQGECINLQNNKQDAATSVNYNNISNCITEIPQDIKVTLSNGTLIIKEGSKIWYPNGFEQDGTTPKFDQITLTSDESDLSFSENTDGQYFIFKRNASGLSGYYGAILSSVGSGNSTTLFPINSGVYYDITYNRIDWYDNNIRGDRFYSFPICIITKKNGVIKSIDQVFNGFGYIGSTLFNLPGVKGLVPDGRNADGTLKNIEFTVPKVGIFTRHASKNEGAHLYCYDIDDQYSGDMVGYVEVESLPDISTVDTWVRYYVKSENMTYVKELSTDTSYTRDKFFICGNADVINKSWQHIKSLHINNPFRAVDRSELQYKQDSSTAINHNNISNCITEIPQDIKLELNAGTLTLKSGSKFYVPDGFEDDNTTRKYAVRNTTSDISTNLADSGTYDAFVFLDPNMQSLQIVKAIWVESGSASYLTSQYRIWYDTTNNLVKWTWNTGSDWQSGYSLPIAMVKVFSGVIRGIQQVFNGLGYIGRQMFVLPGIKGLIPDGFNSDGSLKSIQTPDISTVLIKGMSSSLDNTVLYLDAYGKLRTQERNMRYNKQINRIVNIDTGDIWNMMELAYFICDSSFNIKMFSSKSVFHAVDYNEFSEHKLVYFTNGTFSSSDEEYWCRKYSDGWVEQGGRLTKTIGTTATSWEATLYAPMENNRYSAVVTVDGNLPAQTVIGCSGNTTTKIKGQAVSGSSASRQIMWMVCGRAAS